MITELMKGVETLLEYMEDAGLLSEKGKRVRNKIWKMYWKEKGVEKIK